jgi:acetyltransferase-like isoleucine patch superfamily enzyme
MVRVTLRKIKTDGLIRTIAIALVRINERIIRPIVYRMNNAIVRFFGMKLGEDCKISWRSRIVGHRHVVVGNNLFIDDMSFIKCLTSQRGDGKPALVIGDNVQIMHCVTIDANYYVEIGDNTMLAPFSYIVDNNHSYKDIHIPIRDQGSEYASVTIGKNCWIGAHVIILSGVSIGDHVVVAANSTVTKNIPSFSIAAGSPAKILRQI